MSSILLDRGTRVYVKTDKSPPSEVLSDLLDGFKDDYKQIKREERLNHEERESQLDTDLKEALGITNTI